MCLHFSLSLCVFCFLAHLLELLSNHGQVIHSAMMIKMMYLISWWEVQYIYSNFNSKLKICVTL